MGLVRQIQRTLEPEVTTQEHSPIISDAVSKSSRVLWWASWIRKAIQSLPVAVAPASTVSQARLHMKMVPQPNATRIIKGYHVEARTSRRAHQGAHIKGAHSRRAVAAALRRSWHAW